MTSETKEPRRLVLHPVLFAAFPVLYAYAESRREVDLADVLPPLVVIVGGALALFGLLWVFVRDAQKAGIATSAIVVLFFSYGYVVEALRAIRIGSFVLGAHRIWLPVWALLAVGAGVLAVRGGRWLPRWTRGLNVWSGILVLVNVATVVLFAVGGERAPAAEGTLAVRAGPVPGKALDKRDVYFIVLDRYARSDVLRDVFGHDNAPFESFLRDKGFEIVPDARANYPRTLLSLTSTLNMSYLDRVAREVGASSSDERPLRGALKVHSVGRLFQQEGYRYAHLGSWYGPTSTSETADIDLTLGGFSEFSTAIFQRTAAAPFASSVSEKLNFRRREYRRILFQLEQLRRMPERRGPLFVFAHVLATHGPYLFDREGRFVPARVQASRPFERNYREQVIWLNRQLRDLVTRLLSGPEDEHPIIILQSDEGPRSYPPNPAALPDELLREKVSVFSAVYLPSQRGTELPRTPVNLFRTVFNRYLGFDLPPLPDRTYVFRDASRLYDFVDVTDRVG